MDGTISTRAGEGQRANDGLHAFFGAQGADAIASAASMEVVEGGLRPLATAEEIHEDGYAFLSAVFGNGWERLLQPSRLEAAPIDQRWVQRRIERLKPMSDGPMRLLSQLIWDLSTLLSQPDWFETWKTLALRCPAWWLVQFCGVAVRQSPVRRAPGKKSFNRGAETQTLRSRDSRRVQSMLSLGVLAWQLAEYDPSDQHYPYVIRGLPYGAWQHLVAYCKDYADGPQWHVPGSTTLFGTHEVGGRWDRSECGYIESWCQAGIAKRYQPHGFSAPPGMAGPWRENERGERVRWAFVEVRLAEQTPGLAPLVDEPSGRPWRKLPPPPATGELDAFSDERARSWYPDEDVADSDSGRPRGSAASSLPENTNTARVGAWPLAALARPLPASEWRSLNAQVDELERVWYRDAQDELGATAAIPDATVSCECEADTTHAHAGGNPQEPADVLTDSEAAVTAMDAEETHPLPLTEPDVWLTPRGDKQRASEPTACTTSLEAAALAPQEIERWPRARLTGDTPPSTLVAPLARADVVAGSTLDPTATPQPSSSKFDAALAAYEAEKARREQARAEQRNKRKAPS